MPKLSRALMVLVATAALGVGSALVAPAAFAATNVDISDGSGRLTATVSFTSGTSFRLSNVTLYDINCDHRSAMFEAWDDYGALTVHVNGNGCNTSVHWNQLDGDSNGAGSIHFVQLHVYACSTTCSRGEWSDEIRR